jgi:hypothetical protein
VRAALDGLGVLAVHDVIVPDRRGLTQIDHLVRAPDAVLVLQTRRYSGIVSSEVNGREWVQCFEDRTESFVLPNPRTEMSLHVLAYYMKRVIAISGRQGADPGHPGLIARISPTVLRNPSDAGQPTSNRNRVFPRCRPVEVLRSR